MFSALNDGQFAFNLNLDDKGRSSRLRPAAPTEPPAPSISPFGFPTFGVDGGAAPYIGSFDPFGDGRAAGSDIDSDIGSLGRKSRFDFARRSRGAGMGSPLVGSLALPTFELEETRRGSGDSDGQVYSGGRGMRESGLVATPSVLPDTSSYLWAGNDGGRSEASSPGPPQSASPAPPRPPGLAQLLAGVNRPQSAGPYSNSPHHPPGLSTKPHPSQSAQQQQQRDGGPAWSDRSESSRMAFARQHQQNSGYANLLPEISSNAGRGGAMHMGMGGSGQSRTAPFTCRLTDG